MAQSPGLSEASYLPSEHKTAHFGRRLPAGEQRVLSFPGGAGAGRGSECSQEEEGPGGSHECLLSWERSRNWEGRYLC